MTGTPSPLDVERFRALVARGLGLNFDDTKLGFLGEILRERAETNRHTCKSYLDRLEGQSSPNDEVTAVAEKLTVGETYFLRNVEQFRVFADVALPDRMRAREAHRSLRILSAGCASGEEPYSLAMLLLQHVREPGWDVSLRAVDINPSSLKKAAKARYAAWSLRETPMEVQRRWFKADGREFTLDEAVRRAVAFERRNLADESSDLWRPESQDIVFCRNVIMYFTPENAQALIRRIGRLLAPGGYLFLGHAETLRGLSQDFHLFHTHGTFYYQRKAVPEGFPPAPEVPWERGPLTAATPPVAAPNGAATWVETIQHATDRIQALVANPAPPVEGAQPDAPRPSPPVWDLQFVLEMVRRERFADALQMLRALPPESERDRDVLLLHAALLTQTGQLGAAERLCAKFIEADELNAGAHYLIALCREGSGDCCGAIEHDQVAAYLDPEFAMPRLHLGLLARRAGERDAAGHELAQALLLLQREEASRLLLFGGGFSRDALIGICRAELALCGGHR
ncbi:MAG: methyltransferase domain-containing protein [Proteobacteria bacterium]|nr:methyltransferase domain-containing protein [Pseudomonadota bacterium]